MLMNVLWSIPRNISRNYLRSVLKVVVFVWSDRGETEERQRRDRGETAVSKDIRIRSNNIKRWSNKISRTSNQIKQ